MNNMLIDNQELKQRLHQLIDEAEDENELLRLYIALSEPDLMLKRPVVQYLTMEQSQQLQQSIRNSP